MEILFKCTWHIYQNRLYFWPSSDLNKFQRIKIMSSDHCGNELKVQEQKDEKNLQMTGN